MKKTKAFVPYGLTDFKAILKNEKDDAVVFSAISEALFSAVHTMCDDIVLGIDTLNTIKSSEDYDRGMRILMRALGEGAKTLSDIGEIWKGKGYPWRDHYQLREN